MYVAKFKSVFSSAKMLKYLNQSNAFNIKDYYHFSGHWAVLTL